MEFVCVFRTAGSNAELEYLILSVTPTSNIPIFSVDLNTGVISADRELDRETQDEYDITIQVLHALSCSAGRGFPLSAVWLWLGNIRM